MKTERGTLVKAIVTFRVDRLPRKEAKRFALREARGLVSGIALYGEGRLTVKSVRFPRLWL